MSGTSRNVQRLPASTASLRNLLQSPSKERATMQQARRKWLPCAILSLLALPLSAEAQTEKKLDGLQPVTHERLLKGTEDTSSWLMYGGSYQSWRFSPLKDITRQNVKKLAPAWILQTGAPGQLEASPVVADGVLY